MDIYQHFHPDEYDFIDKVLEWKKVVMDQYCPKLTDFLTPREQQIISSLIGSNDDINVSFFGGSETSERKRAILFPPYLDIHNDDFHITLFKVNYPTKFARIEHPQVLGSLMGLGLRREKFGDILVEDDNIQLIVEEEIAGYVQQQLSLIGKTKISLSCIDFSQIIEVKEQLVEAIVTVSSLRLDAIISTVFHLSRQKSQLMIQKGFVSVNWKAIEQSSYECKDGDSLSVRKFGRCKIISIGEKTKKDRWRIVIGHQR